MVSQSRLSSEDNEYLEIALRLARRGLGRASPNPSVGAVIVEPRQGEVLGRGWTQPGGRPHAEAIALERAGPRADGATLYVTLEPCAHKGETPPCTRALIKAGIGRVVCATGDPDSRVAGQGFEQLRAAGITVDLADDTGEANWVAAGHFLRQRANRPFVQLKLAVGSDGKIAAANGAGKPVWVTGRQARARGHLLRAKTDAIIVGKGTALADDPTLTCRLPGLIRHSPIRVVFDTHLALADGAQLLATVENAELWILTGSTSDSARRAELEAKNVRVLVVETDPDGRIDIAKAFERLAGEGITRALVEGGPNLARSCLDADLIDEALFFAGNDDVGEEGLLPFVDRGLERLTSSHDFTQCAEHAVGLDRLSVYRRRV